MPIRLLLLLAFLVPATSSADILLREGRRILESEIEPKDEPAGRLGPTVGTVVEIEAKIVRAEDVGFANRTGRYLLQVLKVNGATLRKKPSFMYSMRGQDLPKLPDDIFDLYKMKTGKDPDELSSERIQKAEAGYVGRVLTFLASEIGNPVYSVDPDPFGDSLPGGSALLLFKELKKEAAPKKR